MPIRDQSREDCDCLILQQRQNSQWILLVLHSFSLLDKLLSLAVQKELAETEIWNFTPCISGIYSSTSAQPQLCFRKDAGGKTFP